MTERTPRRVLQLRITWLAAALAACASPPVEKEAVLGEAPVLARVVDKDGGRWILRACGGDFACEPPVGTEFLVEVRHPLAADLRVGRRVYVRGEPGGMIGRRRLVLVTDEQGIDPRDEDGGG